MRHKIRKNNMTTRIHLPLRLHLLCNLGALGGLLLAGCNEPTDLLRPDRNDPHILSVRFVTEGSTPTRFDDSAIARVSGFLFVDGVLHEILAGEETAGESHTFHPSVLDGELHFVANAPETFATQVKPGQTTLDEFRSLDASIEELCAEHITLCGSVSLAEVGADPYATVTLRRSVARIDLVTAESGVDIRRVEIHGLYDRGYVVGLGYPATPNGASTRDFRKEYAEHPLTTGSETLLHLCEQDNESLSVEVIASFGDGLHRLTTTLPTRLYRNRIYTLRILGAGADAAIVLSDGEWSAGANTEAQPAAQGLIDLEASHLPAGVTVAPTLDSVRVASGGGRIHLAIRSEAGSEVEIEGNIRGVDASVEAQTRQLTPTATVTIHSERRMPGERQSYLYLNIRQQGRATHTGRIVVVFEPNPVHFSGQLVVDATGVCDFGRYLDGEIGRISLPEGKEAHLSFDVDEDPWLQLAPSEEHSTLRLLAGWKPNDPKADGRPQEGRLVIANRDGSDVETYVVRRLNWGLPVVQIGSTWWCKYNLRGEATKFADQISIQDDPAADTDLADYLVACSSEELLRLMGDQYQAGNTIGLPLRHDGTSFYHEGMKATAQNFGTLDPTAMAPDGYRIPSYEEYAYLCGSQNYNLGGIGTRSYRNAAGEELTIRIQEREAEYLGQHYGTVAFYEFSTATGCWVLYGLGHQWNTTTGNIAPMMLLLATHGNSANSWFMEGYAQADRPNQNWLKYASQNTTKTRVIRCVKSPVEYIYE